METPVALIIFRRADLTRRVLESIASAKPRRLFVIADGPRPDHPADQDGCEAARRVIGAVNWDCEVVKNYSDTNVGCGPRVATGLDWLFDQVEEAIIMEDDCVPEPSFFPFCTELLARYREDERVMHINGSTYRRHVLAIPHSYYYSQFVGCWGWATWRRAWKHYDYSLSLWPEFREVGWLEAVLDHDHAAVQFWQDKFQRAHERGLTTWDYQWAFACWAHSGLGIVPRHNLVSNVGCDNDGTHTFGHPLGNLPVWPMTFPLSHPPMVLPHWKLDREFLREVLVSTKAEAPNHLSARCRRAVSRMAPKVIKRFYRELAKGASPTIPQESHR